MKIILVMLSLMVIIAGCANESYVEIEGEKITVELAQTSSERQQGLMSREELCESCGMLFVFEEEKKHSFWMKDTLIPLDMVFIDPDSIIVDVVHAVPCTEDPCVSYAPEQEALYVLETNVNRFDEGVIGKKAIIVLR
ncbi:MAG: DUF192 domain-containing protein [Nanoarchaeota archaeon]|nr:DUF192 domain-containing protein [Nanoarchaeota archaeon]